ncbi:unnamed protein product [Cylindrotheca closterium]|uniref:Uncharacterized protein n=1 Tax=Cylindrotheca closterium TaxID=2856 RepID=A0AAD2PXA6_9STRA|nr:unnamed protein product [Cylindrotheca closterium]
MDFGRLLNALSPNGRAHRPPVATVNSDLSNFDAGLSDGEPTRNPGEAPPDTEGEEEDPKEIWDGTKPAIEDLIHLDNTHCRANFIGPTVETEHDLLVCGKATRRCREHKDERKVSRAEPQWLLRVESAHLDKNGESVFHGKRNGFRCSEERMEARLCLDHVRRSDDEYPQSSGVEESEVESERETDEYQSRMDKIAAEIARLEQEALLTKLKAKQALLEKDAFPAGQPSRKSPSKRKKKTQSTPKKPTPIARKKNPTKKPTNK